jgi:hypothetical protein
MFAASVRWLFSERHKAASSKPKSEASDLGRDDEVKVIIG